MSEKGRTLVIGDIHGGYKALIQVLERAVVNANDKLIFLGDYVDGWSQSPEVISKLIDLSKTNNCVFLRGNHDELFYKYMQTKEGHEMWLRHGGASSVKAYEDRPQDIVEEHLDFLSKLQNYHIDSENRAYVHAGFTDPQGPAKEYYPYILYWDRTLWETALATDTRLQPDDVRFPKRFTCMKEVFIGHTPTTRIGKTVPVNALNVWNIDTGSAFKGPLTIMDADTKEFFQSDPVYTLYPEEVGRN